MPTDAQDPIAFAPRRRSRRRVALIWAVFGAATLAAAIAVQRLHATVQRELREQGEAAQRDAVAKFLARAAAASEALRHDTIKTLAALHNEGLGHALRSWQEGDPAITVTFQWNEAKGFLPGLPTFAPTLAMSKVPDDAARVWSEFRARRVRHSQATTTETVDVGAYLTRAFRMIDNPLFPAAELGYQAENLGMLTYAGRLADPWAGWAGHRAQAAAPWVFWYQAGPGAPVRGCLVDTTALVASLRAELAETGLARMQLIPAREVAGKPRGTATDLGAILPAFALVAAPGDLFAEKQGEARLAGLAAAALLGVFVLGAAYLATYSHRELRDAERKADFVAQVSHELRTPLTSIRMFADMLGAPELPGEKRVRFAGTIRRESERLSALIERLLSFNALARGAPAAAVEAIDVAATVRETLDEMEATLRDAGMTVEADLPGGLPCAATDRAALKQALLNLIDNALKYARGGRVVRLALACAPEGVRLRVADEGPGVPRELGARAFEPFVQGGRALTDKPSGVGLGLSIARGLLRQAGGDLVLLPSEKGAVFEIRLPLAPPP